MKKSILALIVITVGFALAGCTALSNLGSKPPTKLESKLFDVATNVVQNVTWQTNIVQATNFVTLTNATGLVVTNPVITATPLVIQQTNFATNFTFTPNATAGTVQATGGVLASPFGWGGVVTGALGGLFSLYAGLRSKNANKISGSLAQGIELAKSVMSQVPGGGSQLVDSFTSRLQKNQQSLGIVQDVAGIIDQYVDTDTADAHASTVLAKAGTPTPPPAPTTIVRPIVSPQS